MQVILFILLILCAATVSADGLAVKDGKLVDDHTVIELSESQAEEVEVLGTVTLTDVQWRNLREVSPSCPKRFTKLLSIDHNDCTCGMSEYLVILSGRRAALLHGLLEDEQSDDLKMVFTKKRPDVYGTRWDNYFAPNLEVRIDSKGLFYLAGLEIPFDKLRYVLSLPQEGEYKSGDTAARIVKNDRYISFHVPPLTHPSRDTKTKVLQLSSIAKASGWAVGLDPSISAE